MEVSPRQLALRARLRWLWIGATVLVNVLLALVVSAGLIWLAGRPGLRRRIDLTVNQANTLDANARTVIDNLRAPIEIDVFFRPYSAPLEALGGEIQQRMFESLVLAEEYAPDKIKLTNHPYAAPGTGGAELLAKMTELGVRESNLFVVSNGKRRVAMKLLGEVAEIDIGNPSPQGGRYRPPSIVSFRGLETLVKALLRVTQGEKPLALFATGHGERAIFESEDRDLGRLHSALAADGFRIETWDSAEDGQVPTDCALLALVGTDEPFSPETSEWIAEYVRGGGSLIVAPSLFDSGGDDSLTGILETFGISTGAGFACRPVINAAGMAEYGHPESAQLIVRAAGMRTTHPITETLRRGDRRVRLIFSRIFERGRPPEGGILLDILRTSQFTWNELPDEEGLANWSRDAARESQGPFTLAMTSVFPVEQMGPTPQGENSIREECRVLAVGTPEVFANALFDVNRDFLLNSFNWAANREFRVKVTPLQVDDRRLDVSGDRTLSLLNLVAIWLMPLGCLAMAFFSAWRRRH